METPGEDIQQGPVEVETGTKPEDVLGEPSAADLDTVAGERGIADATAGESDPTSDDLLQVVDNMVVDHIREIVLSERSLLTDKVDAIEKLLHEHGIHL